MESRSFRPTDVGRAVSKFLSAHFTRSVDYDFTAKLEDELDAVSRGEEDWVPLMEKFWSPFKELVDEKSESVDRSEATGARELGTDPKSGKPVSVRLGRFGPYAQIGDKDVDEKLEFASLRPGQSMHTITLEDAIELFKLPRTLGESNGETVTVGIGRFGAFAKRGSTYASLKEKEGDDPHTIDLARAVFLIEEKEEIARNRIIKEWDGHDVQVLNGRYGPYLSDGKLNGKIPKDREPASLTLEEALQFLAETGKPARKGFGAKKAAAKKAAEKKAATKKAPAEKKAAGKAPKKAPAKKSAKKTATKKAVKKAYVSPHPEPAKPLLTPATSSQVGKRVVKKKDAPPF